MTFRTAANRRKYLSMLLWSLPILACVDCSSSFSFHGDCVSLSEARSIFNQDVFRRLLVKRSASARKSGPKDASSDLNIVRMEKEVMESTRAKLDLQRLNRLFQRDPVIKEADHPTSSWKVALAAGTVAAGLSYAAIHSPEVSGVAFLAIFFVATRDPLDEDSAAGAAARVVGRVTLKSAKAAQPKVRAIARAAVQGEEEWLELKTRVEQLEKTNAELRLWKQRRIAVDQALPDYTLDELKNLARESGLTVGGTKTQLMMRLVEAQVLEL